MWCSPLLLFTNFRIPDLAGAKHDAPAAPQAPEHLVHEHLQGLGPGVHRRSCLGLNILSPHGLPYNF
jgi:hypothetical protein